MCKYSYDSKKEHIRDEMVGWVAGTEGKNAIDRGFWRARFGSGEWRSVRLVVLVSGRLSGKTGLHRPASSRAVPGAHRLSGSVRGAGAAGAGSAAAAPRPNMAMPASPPENNTRFPLTSQRQISRLRSTSRLRSDFFQECTRQNICRTFS